MQIPLSSGETVHFRAWKRKAEKVYLRTLRKDVKNVLNAETGMFEAEEFPANCFDLAWEAVLPVLIERIDRGGAEVAFSQEWLDNLETADSDRLERAALQQREAAKASGDKSV